MYKHLSKSIIALAFLCAGKVYAHKDFMPASYYKYAPNTIVYNVKDYGAKGDGVTIESDAINKTIDVAAAAGGGTVYIPAGKYMSYTIRMKSNISLYLDQGAVLIAAEPVNGVGFDKPEPDAPYAAYQDWAHSHWKTGFICGENLHDISILGQGLIWGKGLTRATDRGIPAGMGNEAISLKLCRNVTIRDVSILHGGHFGILATGVDNLTIDNLKIDTNRDGMDIDCCKNVRVSNCTVNSPGDDGICLKSSFGLGYARATENVTITNCQVSGYDEGTLLDGTYQKLKSPKNGPTGRIKMGTESNGGFKNITISNCVFDYSRGLALETADGAILEDITITNITMREIVNAPIFIRLGARMRGPDSIPVGVCRRIIISNIVASNVDNKQGALISGIPGHEIEDLQLNNIRIYYKGGGTAEMAGKEVAELEKDYPEPYRFGELPSYGFFIRHAKNVSMRDIDINYMKDDVRPPFIFTDVKGIDLHNIKAQKASGVPTIQLNNVTDLSLQQVRGLSDAEIKSADKKNL
ncbi:glycoside hydrolase family 28 protein [Chitinophagaceae bacterium LWZ2-11]